MMKRKTSKLAKARHNGQTQVETQRANILVAAEHLFLEKGLENTKMSDIAARAGITRMSLYRYFPDRDPIAFEIAVRMLRRITESAYTGEQPFNFEAVRRMIMRMIEQFYPLRDAHRYLGMFDHLYQIRYPNETLANWYKEQIFSLTPDQEGSSGVISHQVLMILNCVLSFLQKMAVRGDLLVEEQGLPLDEQLGYFEDMISVYLERLAIPR